MRKGRFVSLVFSKVPYTPNLVFHGEENGIFICHWQSLKIERSIHQVRFLLLMFLLVTLQDFERGDGQSKEGFIIKKSIHVDPHPVLSYYMEAT